MPGTTIKIALSCPGKMMLAWDVIHVIQGAWGNGGESYREIQKSKVWCVCVCVNIPVK